MDGTTKTTGLSLKQEGKLGIKRIKVRILSSKEGYLSLDLKTDTGRDLCRKYEAIVADFNVLTCRGNAGGLVSQDELSVLRGYLGEYEETYQEDQDSLWRTEANLCSYVGIYAACMQPVERVDLEGLYSDIVGITTAAAARAAVRARSGSTSSSSSSSSSSNEMTRSIRPDRGPAR